MFTCPHCGGDHRACESEPPLFDAARGELLKAEAMSAVDEAASEVWKAHADIAIDTVARRRTELLTADDVWAELDRLGIRLPEGTDSRALGPRMTRAATVGLIVKTGTTRLTARAVAHRRPLQVWRSLVYRP
jgi:hypothetical protein